MLNLATQLDEYRGSRLLTSGLRFLVAYPLAAHVIGLPIIWILLVTSKIVAAIVIATIMEIVALGLCVRGVSRVVRGVDVLAPLAEHAWRAQPGLGLQIAALTESLAASDDETASAPSAAAAREELLARFSGTDPVGVLLSDTKIGATARDLRRMYGRAVAASYLQEQARKLNLGDAAILEADLPDDF